MLDLNRSYHTEKILASVIAFFIFLTRAANAEAAVNIVNELTEKHSKAPGTEVYFIVPDGLSPSERFDGFASSQRKIEVIVANIKSPYGEISKGFTDSALKTRGVEVGSRGDLTINSSQGILLKAIHKDGDNKWGKWILLLDDGDSTLVVNGVFVSGDADAARDIEAMLKSVVIRKDEKTAPESDVSRDERMGDDE
jgi:hypothetical protein